MTSVVKINKFKLSDMLHHLVTNHDIERYVPLENYAVFVARVVTSRIFSM